MRFIFNAVWWLLLWLLLLLMLMLADHLLLRRLRMLRAAAPIFAIAVANCHTRNDVLAVLTIAATVAIVVGGRLDVAHRRRMLYGSLMHLLLSICSIFGRIRLAGGRRRVLAALVMRLRIGAGLRRLGLVFAVRNGDNSRGRWCIVDGNRLLLLRRILLDVAVAARIHAIHISMIRIAVVRLIIAGVVMVMVMMVMGRCIAC